MNEPTVWKVFILIYWVTQIQAKELNPVKYKTTMYIQETITNKQAIKQKKKKECKGTENLVLLLDGAVYTHQRLLCWDQHDDQEAAL